MSIIIRPWGATDLSGATVIAETTLPQVISSLTAGSYEVGRVSWNPSQITVSAPVVTPTTYFTAGATGPYFVDPSNVPANTTRIEFSAKIRMAAYPTSGTLNLFTQSSTGCDLRVTYVSGGASANWQMVVEDGGGTNMVSASTSISAIPALNTWFDVKYDVDQVAQTAKLYIDGVLTNTVPFSAAPSPASFQSVRNISFLASITGTSPIGSNGVAPVDVEYVEAYFTTGGVRSMRKRIAGNAATVNADSWKGGGSAT